MSTYKLQIFFSDNELRAIYETGANVIISKPSINGNDPNVAWQVFKPFNANTITWEENYGIYASTSELKSGAELNQLAFIPIGASMGKLYKLESNATIDGPLSGGTKGFYTLTNNYSEGTIPETENSKKRIMTLGLFQDANINGMNIKGNAVSAAPVLLGSTATMTPYSTVYIWLQSQIRSNTVVTTITSPKTALRFTDNMHEISVSYDIDSGKFVSK
ncbi:hypothetical protein [Kordia sp.]|uniref:hypothetical protein n=1 Tax=Kordia sp. TaxID=1965332 RepID=UPI003B5B9DFF